MLPPLLPPLICPLYLVGQLGRALLGSLQLGLHTLKLGTHLCYRLCRGGGGLGGVFVGGLFPAMASAKLRKGVQVFTPASAL